MNIIITTVGTSLFTNYLKKEVQDCANKVSESKGKTFNGSSYASAYDNSVNNSSANKDELYDNHIKKYFLWNMTKKVKIETDEYENHVQTKKVSWAYSPNEQLNKHACAEIQSIQAIIEQKKWKEYKIYFLHTTTPLSALAATILCQDVYTDKAICIPVAGLEVSVNNTFNDEGFKTLADKILEIKESTNPKDEIILNVTGGYKGTIPIATLLGQLLDIPIFYIYEDSETPIEIAKLPINFDWSSIESMASYMTDEYLNTIQPDSEVYKLFDKAKLVKTENGKVKMSGIGQILHKSLFKGGLHNSILGDFVEYKLYHYFCTATDELFTKPVMFEFDKPMCYRCVDGNYDFKDCVINNKGNATPLSNYKELGDIDLVLSYKEGVAICEIKSHFQIIRDFFEWIDKPNDYYLKIKARIEYWLNTKKTLPKTFLFIVHKIKILQQADIAMNADEKLMTVLNHFAQKIQADYQGKVAFIAKGAWIDLKQDTPEVNYTSLFRNKVTMETLLPLKQT